MMGALAHDVPVGMVWFVTVNGLIIGAVTNVQGISALTQVSPEAIVSFGVAVLCAWAQVLALFPVLAT